MKPDEPPDADAWKVVQEGLNRVGLAKPPLEVDGDPGEMTLAAAEGLVPLIRKTQKQDNLAEREECALLVLRERDGWDSNSSHGQVVRGAMDSVAAAIRARPAPKDAGAISDNLRADLIGDLQELLAEPQTKGR